MYRSSEPEAELNKAGSAEDFQYLKSCATLPDNEPKLQIFSARPE